MTFSKETNLVPRGVPGSNSEHRATQPPTMPSLVPRTRHHRLSRKWEALPELGIPLLHHNGSWPHIADSRLKSVVSPPLTSPRSSLPSIDCRGPLTTRSFGNGWLARKLLSLSANMASASLFIVCKSHAHSCNALRASILKDWWEGY